MVLEMHLTLVVSYQLHRFYHSRQIHLGQVSDAMRNLIMQHADARTFVKHYMSSRVAVDTQAIIRGTEQQSSIMRAVCRMSRTIDLMRPRVLTIEQSLSVNEAPSIVALENQRMLAKDAESRKELSREIRNERQRLRSSLLRHLRDRWDVEQSILEIERQLAGLKCPRAEASAPVTYTPAQRHLITTILSEPGSSLEAEYCRRNNAIQAVIDYCCVEEGRTRRKNEPTVATLSTKAHVGDEIANAIRIVNQAKRPRICFLCLGNTRLTSEQRVYAFYTSSDLSKHVRRAHLSAMDPNEPADCKLCNTTLTHKMHFQRHALEAHGTVT